MTTTQKDIQFKVGDLVDWNDKLLKKANTDREECEKIYGLPPYTIKDIRNRQSYPIVRIISAGGIESRNIFTKYLIPFDDVTF